MFASHFAGFGALLKSALAKWVSIILDDIYF